MDTFTTPTEKRLDRALRDHFEALEALRKARRVEREARERVFELMGLNESEVATRKARKPRLSK